jgi:hypothetical protein
MARAVLLTVAGAVLWSVPVAGQTVRVLVMDPETSIPAAAGYVVLLDSDSAEAGRALNSQDGLLAVRAPSPGVYRLASVRAGYHTRLSEPFTVEDGQAVDMVLDLATERVDLSRVPTSSENACLAPREDEGIGLLWHETATVLAATQWGGRDGLEYYSILYQRELDATGDLVFLEQTDIVQGLILQTTTDGSKEDFVVVPPDSGLLFNPPTPAWLLTDEFATDYCFRATRGQGVVGLSFSPRAAQEGPDIAGTFWLDAETAGLQSLEYRFLNIPVEAGADRAQGHVAFMPGPSGRWLASDWELNAPLPAMDLQQNVVLGGLRVSGGRVTAIVQGEEIVFSAPLAELTGVVHDSAGVAGLSGAVVTLVGTDYAAATDDNGRFRIAGPLSGTYRVAFTHPILDAQQLFSPDTAVALQVGQETTLSLHPVAGSDYLGALMARGGGRRARAEAPAGEDQVTDYRGRPTNSRNVITQEELEEVPDLTAVEVVSRLRPSWLRNRGTINFGGTTSNPVVFRNGKYMGDLAVLSAIPVEEIGEIWYFDRMDVAQRWGSRRFPGGVIEIVDRR